MAKGFNIFTTSTNKYEDIRYRRLRKKFGCEGICVYDYLLCEIHRKEGYYTEWNADTAFVVSEYFFITEELVSNIVEYCADLGLFSGHKLTEGILTSEEIQAEYKENCKRSRRNVAIEERIDTQVISSTPKESEEGSQERDDEDDLKSQIHNLFFFRNFKNPQEEVQRFYDHYTAVGWKRNGGLKVKDKLALARLWKPRDETQSFPQEFLSGWEEYYQMTLAPELISGLKGVLKDEATKRIALQVSSELNDYLHKNEQDFVRSFIDRHYPSWRIITRVYG